MIAAQAGDVREQKMRDEHRLRLAQVCVRRHQRVTGARRQIDQRRHDEDDLLLDDRDSSLQVEPEIDGDLLVPRSPGMESASGVADRGNQFAFDVGMNILVVRFALECP